MIVENKLLGNFQVVCYHTKCKNKHIYEHLRGCDCGDKQFFSVFVVQFSPVRMEMFMAILYSVLAQPSSNQIVFRATLYSAWPSPVAMKLNQKYSGPHYTQPGPAQYQSDCVQSHIILSPGPA